MVPINANTVPELDSWGTVADLGSDILEGECLAFGKMVFSASDAAVSCAYFGVTQGKFRMIYPFNEHAVVVEGLVTLTNERTGETNTYSVGQGWFVEKDTPVLWEVRGERFVKNYLAIA
ncbi:MAG: DUF861 domain-containing protein [Caulobacter sp.]|nr:DUF861 domain-containing protein [Caulobacter sp.]